MGESRYPWEEYYLAAILETDDAKLPERIGKAEAAIVSRQQELGVGDDGTLDERRALLDSLRGLRVLRKERIEEFSSGSRKESTNGGNQPLG